MKRILLIVPVLLLTGCLSTPVKRSFPDVPEELKATCPDLMMLEPTTKLSEVVSVVAKNYGQYQECQIKSETWVESYKTQKQIFESVK